MRHLVASIVALTWLFLGVNVLGQDCSKNLKEAHTNYDNGNIQELEKMLSGCIDNGFDREQRLDAYKLLTLAFIFDDQFEKADEYMLKFLRLDPEYEIDPVEDPIEFINLYETFKTLPVLSVGLTAGINTTNVQVMERYGVHDPGDRVGQYSSLVGYQFGIMLSKYVFKGLTVNMDIMMTQKSFEYESAPLSNDDKLDIIEFTEIKLPENQIYFETPITFVYELGRKRLRGFVGTGMSFGYLNSVNVDPVRSYTDGALAEVKEGNINITNEGNLRTRFHYWLIAEAGVKYKIKRGFIALDMMYKAGLLNQTIEENRYANQQLTYQYYYVSDDFKLDNIAISASYTYSLYNPKKKKTKK